MRGRVVGFRGRAQGPAPTMKGAWDKLSGNDEMRGVWIPAEAGMTK